MLDLTFGTNGKVLTDFGAPAGAVAMAIQSDGKIVVAGTMDSGTVNFALARYNPDGSLDDGSATDTTPGDHFGTAGRVVTDLGAHDIVSSMALQADGRIVVAGFSWIRTNFDFVLARYNSDGSLDDGSATDTTPGDHFGAGGMVITDFGGDDYAASVAIQADGRIVVAGNTQSAGSASNFALARYLPDGSLDSDFDADGRVVTGFGGAAGASSVAIQPDGRIVAVGRANVGVANLDFALARYLPNGSPDNSFNFDGKVTTDFGGGDDEANSVAIQPDGGILVAGDATVAGGGVNFALARYLPNGSLDNSFNFNGRVMTDFGGHSIASSVAIQPDGRIVAAGQTDSGGGGRNFALARYLPDGSPDTSFNFSGRVATDFGDTTDAANSVAIQANGRIVLAGGSAGSTYTYQANFALAGYQGGPVNHPPVLAAIANQTVSEGSLLTFTASATDPDAGQTLTYSLAPGAPAGATINPTTGVFSWTPPDEASTSITVRVTDNGAPNLSASRTFTVTVTNVAPTVSAGSDVSLPRGGTLSRTGSFTDPGADTWTANVNYGDGTGTQPLALTAAGTFTLNHPYANPGTYNVTVTVADDDGGIGSSGFHVTVVAPPTVQGVVINDGSAQRSMVTSITVSFAGLVQLDGGAFEVRQNGGGVVDLSIVASEVGGHTVAVLRFLGAGIIGGSLMDGNYTLTTRASAVHDSLGQLLDGDGDGTAGGNRTDAFFRLFGDTNGDRRVDNADWDIFRRAYGKRVGEPGYLWYLDFDANGVINVLDQKQFQQRRGTILNP
jgi:uncharacterized delta-60 repeat protein